MTDENSSMTTARTAARYRKRETEQKNGGIPAYAYLYTYHIIIYSAYLERPSWTKLKKVRQTNLDLGEEKIHFFNIWKWLQLLNQRIDSREIKIFQTFSIIFKNFHKILNVLLALQFVSAVVKFFVVHEVTRAKSGSVSSAASLHR